MKYVEGDLFKGIVPNYATKVTTIIPHVCNDVHAWGAGFVIPLAQHFPEARQAFFENKNPTLGDTQFITAANVPVVIANMFAQHDTKPSFEGDKMIPPIRYDALQACMTSVEKHAQELMAQDHRITIACPMFGAGLAGGDWDTIEQMIFLLWSERGLDTTIYYLERFLPPGFIKRQGMK